MFGIRKSIEMAVAAGCFLVANMLNAAAEQHPGGSPNFLFILTDDQGWSQMSQQMHPDIPESRSAYLHTPNMNSLASEGMRFTSGYAPAPLCTPTRRSVLCGTSAARSGTEFKSEWVPAEHMTLPKALKLANPAYRCAHFGKWGELMISSPEECGYDSSDGHTGNITGGMEDKEKEFHLVEDPKRTDTVTERAIQFMSKQVQSDNPFYVQVSYYAVHLRVELLEATLKTYQEKGQPDRGYTAAWAGMLEELDRGVGTLLKALEDLGIADNTYVVFMSDNGGRGTIPHGETSRLPTNHPLSGAKHSLLEGGIRVPFIVRGPGIKPGSSSHVPVVGYDLLPTFYDLAGGRDALTDEVDGGSIVPLFAHPDSGTVNRPLDALVFHRPVRKLESAIRQGDHKLFVSWDQSGEVQSRALYNLQSDISEKQDLSASDPIRADALQKVLMDYLEKVDAEIPLKAGRKTSTDNTQKKKQPVRS